MLTALGLSAAATSFALGAVLESNAHDSVLISRLWNPSPKRWRGARRVFWEVLLSSSVLVGLFLKGANIRDVVLCILSTGRLLRWYVCDYVHYQLASIQYQLASIQYQLANMVIAFLL
jgi:hypothetical protein